MFTLLHRTKKAIVSRVRCVYFPAYYLINSWRKFTRVLHTFFIKQSLSKSSLNITICCCILWCQGSTSRHKITYMMTHISNMVSSFVFTRKLILIDFLTLLMCKALPGVMPVSLLCAKTIYIQTNLAQPAHI